jgi:hypothetical protein
MIVLRTRTEGEGVTMIEPLEPRADAVPEAESTLDPQDWGQLRELGHRMMDDMMDFQEGVRSRPVWQGMPQSVLDRLQEDLPREGRGASAAYDAFRELILPYPMGNLHPRFWGWVIGTGTPTGMLAEMLAAGMNSNAGFGDQAAVRVERLVIDWLAQMLGLPAGWGGLLVSGCSMANFSGLAMARNARAGAAVIGEGMVDRWWSRVPGSMPCRYQRSSVPTAKECRRS